MQLLNPGTGGRGSRPRGGRLCGVRDCNRLVGLGLETAAGQSPHAGRRGAAPFCVNPRVSFASPARPSGASPPGRAGVALPCQRSVLLPAPRRVIRSTPAHSSHSTRTGRHAPQGLHSSAHPCTYQASAAVVLFHESAGTPLRGRGGQGEVRVSPSFGAAWRARLGRQTGRNDFITYGEANFTALGAAQTNESRRTSRRAWSSRRTASDVSTLHDRAAPNGVVPGRPGVVLLVVRIQRLLLVQNGDSQPAKRGEGRPQRNTRAGGSGGARPAAARARRAMRAPTSPDLAQTPGRARRAWPQPSQAMQLWTPGGRVQQQLRATGAPTQIATHAGGPREPKSHPMPSLPATGRPGPGARGGGQGFAVGRAFGTRKRSLGQLAPRPHPWQHAGARWCWAAAPGSGAGLGRRACGSRTRRRASGWHGPQARWLTPCRPRPRAWPW